MDEAGRQGSADRCLPTKAPLPRTGEAWLHEIKHDGFRVVARDGTAGLDGMRRTGQASIADGDRLRKAALARASVEDWNN